MFPGHSLRHRLAAKPLTPLHTIIKRPRSSSPAMNIIKEEPSDFEPMNMDSYYEALSSSPPPSCIPQPDTNSLPFRAKRATVEMRAMMSVFRLDPFAKARGEPSPSKPPGPLEHEPEIMRVIPLVYDTRKLSLTRPSLYSSVDSSSTQPFTMGGGMRPMPAAATTSPSTFRTLRHC